MAKLTAFAALFVALIAVASAYTTVVTTVVDEENPQQSCQMEVQRMQMSHCMQWMERGISPYETTAFLRSAVANAEEHQQECCSEMRKVRPDCHCDMVRKMMMMRPMEPMMMMGKMHMMFSRCGMQFPMGCFM